MQNKTADKLLINNEQLIFFVGFHELLLFAATPGNIQLVQQFWHTGVQNGFEPAAGSVSQGAGKKGLAVAQGPLKDNVVVIVNILACWYDITIISNI